MSELPELPVISEEEFCAMGFPYAFQSECEALGFPYGISPPDHDPTRGEGMED